MAIYFLHVVPTEQRLNFKLYYKTQSKVFGRIKCAVSINPMLQEDVSLLTSFLNVFLLLIPSVKIRSRTAFNAVEGCTGKGHGPSPRGVHSLDRNTHKRVVWPRRDATRV